MSALSDVRQLTVDRHQLRWQRYSYVWLELDDLFFSYLLACGDLGTAPVHCANSSFSESDIVKMDERPRISNKMELILTINDMHSNSSVKETE